MKSKFLVVDRIYQKIKNLFETNMAGLCYQSPQITTICIIKKTKRSF